MTTYTVKDPRNRDELIYAVKPVLMAKQFGNESILASLVVDACLSVMPSKKNSINVDNVRVCKIMGGSLFDAKVVKGMVVQRNTEGMVKTADDAKIVVFGCGIEAAGTEAKSTVLIKTASELMNYNKGEEDRMEESIRCIAESGVKVVIAGGSVRYFSIVLILYFFMIVVKWRFIF